MSSSGTDFPWGSIKYCTFVINLTGTLPSKQPNADGFNILEKFSLFTVQSSSLTFCELIIVDPRCDLGNGTKQSTPSAHFAAHNHRPLHGSNSLFDVSLWQHHQLPVVYICLMYPDTCSQTLCKLVIKFYRLKKLFLLLVSNMWKIKVSRVYQKET